MTESLTPKSIIQYIHGWAGSSALWQDLCHILPPHHATKVDLAFFEGKTYEKTPGDCDFLITHSLGLMWAIKKGCIPRKGVIAINGFQCFMDFTSDAVLQKMLKGLDRNAGLQLKAFLQAADMRMPNGVDPNIDQLKMGLEWLRTWDVRQELQQVGCEVLALTGAQDRICPLESWLEQWQGYETRVHERAGHGLPQTHPDWCAEQITQWISKWD